MHYTATTNTAILIEWARVRKSFNLEFSMLNPFWRLFEGLKLNTSVPCMGQAVLLIIHVIVWLQRNSTHCISAISAILVESNKLKNRKWTFNKANQLFLLFYSVLKDWFWDAKVTVQIHSFIEKDFFELFIYQCAFCIGWTAAANKKRKNFE